MNQSDSWWMGPLFFILLLFDAGGLKGITKSVDRQETVEGLLFQTNLWECDPADNLIDVEKS